MQPSNVELTVHELNQALHVVSLYGPKLNSAAFEHDFVSQAVPAILTVHVDSQALHAE